mgnify:CR=1 FL=1
MTDKENSDRSDVQNFSEEELDQKIADQVRKAFENNMPYFTSMIRDAVKAALEAERAARTEEGGAPRVERKKCTYKEYMVCHPQDYEGEIDPLASMR